MRILYGWEVDEYPAGSDSDERLRWEDLDEIMFLLWPEERQLLHLIREGKGPSDVAQIMGLRCPKNRPWHATKELTRAVEVARFFARHLGSVRRLYAGSLPLTRREVLVLRMYLSDRQTTGTIAEHFGFGSRRWTTQVLAEVRRKLVAADLAGMVAMLDEAVAHRRLRIRRRRIMTSWRDDAKKWLFAMAGRQWYTWGGQNLKNGNADCSGLVLEVLKKFGVLPAEFRDVTAQGLTALYKKTVWNPEVCDLAFYGKSWGTVGHVMFYVGQWETVKLVEGREVPASFDGCVMGMCGGRSGMSEDMARMMGSALWIRTSPRYRTDFLGYRRVE